MLPEHDELVGRDFAAGHARHDGVQAAALHVGQEAIVGVLQRLVLAVEDVLVPQAGQDRGHGRLADFAAVPAAVAGEQLVERLDLLDLDDLKQLLPRVGKVLAQVLVDASCRRPRAPCCRRSVTSGMQPPQPVPALVQALTSPSVVRSLLANRLRRSVPC